MQLLKCKRPTRVCARAEYGLPSSKRSQITIFVIIAIVIIAVIAVIFYPQIKKIIIPQTPEQLVPNECIEENAKQALNLTMARGGSINPELYFLYGNNTISYLCYTSEWYKTCTMQKPFLKSDIEKEIKDYSGQKIEKCIRDMEEILKSRGYFIKVSGSRTPEIEISPGKVIVSFNMSMIIEKDGPKINLDNSRFKTEFNSKSYDLIIIASSIQNYEARLGDSNPEEFMYIYPNLKAEKIKQTDGTKIYILTERNTNEKLIFATRSLAWPPGYAIQE